MATQATLLTFINNFIHYWLYTMLTIKKLSVSVEDKTIIDNISMNFDVGKNYCVIGKNGSGKSSLAMTIMGHPKYIIND